jgi:purine-binding chemotaxis protein CheW
VNSLDENLEILKQYLTFTVDKENYALGVANVREVLEFQQVSKVPRMPDFMRGIINLRGKVVPVIDLKSKFGLGETENSSNASVIVTELMLGKDLIIVGLLTESVSEVLEIEENEIEAAPYIGTNIKTSFIKGIGKKEERFFTLLNIEKVLTGGELSELKTDESFCDVSQ